MPENDLRSALEEAFNAQEGGDDTPSPQDGRPAENTAEPVGSTAPTERSEPVSGTTDAATDQPQSSGEERVRGADGKFLKKDATQTTPERRQDSSTQFKAPESWKPEARDQWTKLPPDVQAEVARREREIVMTLQNTSQQRKIAEDLQQVVHPFMPFLAAENVHPLVAIKDLLGQAAILRVGTPTQKAQLVANVIKNFQVPIKDLDALLVGDQVPDPDAKIAQIIQQQLAPVQQFMQQINTVRQQRAQRADQEIDTEIDQFANDPQNEFFSDVRESMADLMEIAARQGRQMTLKDAYDRAVKMDERVQNVLAKRKQETLSNARAAGSSLPSRSAPTGGTPKGDSLRDDILSAFESVANH